jgi:thiazole synthase
MNQNQSEIIVIGGGIIGLAIAVELQLRGATVSVISGNFQKAAAHAAAGMLAPNAENITSPPLLELCLKSLHLYSEWISKIEQMSGMETGYLPTGIIAPVYTKENQAHSLSQGQWLDQNALAFYQPNLGEDVIGGWWYPEDGQVDNRLLTQALFQTAQSLGVKVKEGIYVETLAQNQQKIKALKTNQGDFSAQHYVLATGAWSHQLLPLPVRPVKGQMLSLQMPQSQHSIPLKRVIYGEQTYLVPRQNGQLIIGATTEEVGFDSQNTSAGIQNLLNRAIRLYPHLKDWNIQEFWSGFRPGTPDELPILGQGFSDNLTLATGHYRNGILLAPVTASLLANQILQNQTDPLLNHFSGDRFLNASPPMNLTISPAHHQITPNQTQSCSDPHPLIIAGKQFSSRLMTGTGKYPSIQVMQESVISSGCDIVTVAVRRVQTNAPGHEGLAEALDWSKIWMLPNTAGCQTAEEAIRVARLGREMAKLLGQEDNNFIKLEVIPDHKYLLPDPIGTLEAAEQLVKEGFAVLPYINADPLLAKRLEEVGCATVMPLGSPIGSGQGIQTSANIRIIIEQSNIPVVVDAGIGTPSEASLAMEMGADALLVNSAIAMAKNPVAMGKAMKLATEAGRLGYLAGRIPVKEYADASSPLTGIINS